jgi:hypothetical protein
VEYSHLDTVLYIDSDELFYCPQVHRLSLMPISTAPSIVRRAFLYKLRILPSLPLPPPYTCGVWVQASSSVKAQRKYQQRLFQTYYSQVTILDTELSSGPSVYSVNKFTGRGKFQ